MPRFDIKHMFANCLQIKKSQKRETSETPVILVIATGFEPVTVCLEGRCSIQLSYATILTFLKCACEVTKNNGLQTPKLFKIVFYPKLGNRSIISSFQSLFSKNREASIFIDCPETLLD